jgi:hypothetical protein
MKDVTSDGWADIWQKGLARIVDGVASCRYGLSIGLLYVKANLLP